MQQKASDDIVNDMFDIEGQEAAEAEAAAAPEPTSTDTEVEDHVEDEATEQVVTAVPVQDSESEQAPEPQGDGTATGDVDPDDISEIVGPDGKYMTYREVAKGYDNLQSLKDKEIAEVKRAVEEAQQQNQQWNEWYQHQQQEQQQYAEQQQQVQQNTPSSQEELAYNIEVDPMGTFRRAAQYTPELVPSIIAYVRQSKGDHLADSMMLENQQAQNYAIQQQQQQMLEQQQQQMQQPALQQDNMTKAIDAVKQHYGEEFTALEEDVSAALGSGNYKIDFSNPASIAGAVENAYLRVYREKAMEAAKTATDQPQAPAQQAETGSPGQAPVLDEDDQIRQEVVDLQTTPWG